MAPVRLGELLETRGQITRDQLLRALRNQKVLGGRLGTCLLEIEALSEEQLSAALAQQHGVPFATPEDLRGIPEDVLELLPAKVAKRCRAIAFHAGSTQVKVALIEASNLAIQDEITFVIGKRIRWYVASELRMIEALEKHYGEECPSRLAKLLDKMNRSRFLWARESATAAAQVAPSMGAKDQLQWDAQIAGLPAKPAEVSEAAKPGGPAVAVVAEAASATAIALPEMPLQPPGLAVAAPEPPPVPASLPAAAAAPAPPAAEGGSPPKAPRGRLGKTGRKSAMRAESDDTLELPPMAGAPHRKLSVQEAEERLLQPSERDDVARTLLDFAAGLVERAVLFVVRKDEIAAWLWSPEGVDATKLAALRLNQQQPSVFTVLKQGGATFHGQLAPMPAHLAIADCFAPRVLSATVFVVPVRVKARLVAALFLVPAAGADLAAADLDALQRVVAKAEIAFELCIMQSKLRKA